MKIIKWDPFKDTMMVDDFLDALSQGRGSDKAGTWAPAVDVYETGGEIVMTAELPGVSQGDLDLSVCDDVLTLKGERRFERDVKQEKYYRVERNYGYFCRRFKMPCEVRGDKINASFADGVLKVVIPKKASGRKVHVKVQR